MGFFGFTKDICRRRSGHVLSHIRKRFSWWWKCSSKWKKLTLYWPVLECVGEKLLVKKQILIESEYLLFFLNKCTNLSAACKLWIWVKVPYSRERLPVFGSLNKLPFKESLVHKVCDFFYSKFVLTQSSVHGGSHWISSFLSHQLLKWMILPHLLACSVECVFKKYLFRL